MSELVLYHGAYTGIQVDAAISRALAGGELDTEINALKSAVGSPLLAATVADMTDTNKIYVYTGSETGYVNGNWYFWNGSAWESGGQYLSGGYTFDPVPIEGSTNPVESNGLYPVAQNAQNALDYALAALVTDTASGAVVSIPDGANGVPVKDLTVQITPVQDLHGQDAPYPAGGGKNKCDKSAAVGGYLDNSGTLVSASSGITYVTDYIPVSSGETVTISPSNTGSMRRWFYTAKGGAGSALISGNTYTAPSDGWIRITVQGISVAETRSRLDALQVEDGSYATSYAPYENICPITGWTGAEIADVSDYQPYFAGLLAGTYGFVDLASLNWERNTGYSRPRFIAQLSSVKNGGSTLTTAGYENVSTISALLNNDKAILLVEAGGSSEVMITDSDYADKDAFTAAMSGVYLIYELATPTTPISTANYNMLLTAFGLQGWTETVTWQDEAGTVFGGNVLPLTGDLTAQMRGVDLGSLTWTATAISNGRTAFTAPYSSFPVAPFIDTNAMPNALAPVAKGQYQNADSWGTNCFLYYVTGSTLPEYTIAFIFNDGTYADANAFKTAMSGLYFAYQINAEQTYQLTPVQINTLHGNNNIWSDTGDTSVTYRADTGLYIQKILGN